MGLVSSYEEEKTMAYSPHYVRIKQGNRLQESTYQILNQLVP